MGSIASATWPGNNKAYFYPFTVKDHAVAYQLLFWVGGTSAGNIDVGIYDSQKNKVVSSGSTAMSATVSTWQELNIADTPLPPGDYLLAAACSTTTGTGMSVNTSDEILLSNLPVYEQANALALPDPCTPVFCTDATVPIWGIGIQTVPTF